jgi:hypothetical protein
VIETLRRGSYDGNSLPVLLRLWLAAEDGTLEHLLVSLARRWNSSYEEMCASELHKLLTHGRGAAADSALLGLPRKVAAITRQRVEA